MRQHRKGFCSLLMELSSKQHCPKPHARQRHPCRRKGAHTTATKEPTSAPETSSTKSSRSSADPYHTDVYPENVYSEEYLYDADGNLIGKNTTIPTAFGPDTVWIEGRVYYDVPGF